MSVLPAALFLGVVGLALAIGGGVVVTLEGVGLVSVLIAIFAALFCIFILLGTKRLLDSRTRAGNRDIAAIALLMCGALLSGTFSLRGLAYQFIAKQHGGGFDLSLTTLDQGSNADFLIVICWFLVLHFCTIYLSYFPSHRSVGGAARAKPIRPVEPAGSGDD